MVKLRKEQDRKHLNNNYKMKNQVNKIDVDSEFDEWLEDGNFEEQEEDESEETSLPPRIGKEDISFRDLEELDS